MDVNQIIQTTLQVLTQFGLKIVGAIIFWIVGRWLISIAVRLLVRSLKFQKIDATILSYIVVTLKVTLNIILIVAILGFFGIETTSFAALLAAAGVAIGAAWGGLLANFAAGTILIVLRPFRVGDSIFAAGVTGTVRGIRLFRTTIDMPDNVLTIIGNN